MNLGNAALRKGADTKATGCGLPLHECPEWTIQRQEPRSGGQRLGEAGGWATHSGTASPLRMEKTMWNQMWRRLCDLADVVRVCA